MNRICYFLIGLLAIPASTATLVVRDLKLAVDPVAYETEKDNSYVTLKLALIPAKTALIIIDPWATHPTDGWLARAEQNMYDYLKPLVDAARLKGIRIVYAPSNQTISSIVTPQATDTIINTPGSNTDDVALDNKLTGWGVDTIIYAGYASNICVLDKPAGARLMYAKNPSRRMILVRDATIGFEMPQTLASEAMKEASIFTFEYQFGVSTTVADVIAALK